MALKRKEIEFLTDQPIKSVNDDKFGRGEFVKAIAEVIHSQTTEVNPEKNPEFKDIDENMIIGLYGSWGFGKSSIMHMLDEILKKQSVQTAFFNPWMYHSEEHLIISLFNTIVDLSGLTGDSKSELIELLQKYQPLISLASGSAGKIASAISKIGDESVKLNAVLCKEQIDRKLLGNANPIVIFIDDVDRLSREEIHILFKTLRLIASFKNIIYVVAFDFDMVSKSIKENYADGQLEDGQAFIEKIIQIPVRIPEVNPPKLLSWATELIRDTVNIDLDRDITFQMLFSAYINTPRDVKRFVNGFRFTYNYLKGFIEPKGLICLELIRSKHQLLFEFIKVYNRSFRQSNSEDFFFKHGTKLLIDSGSDVLKASNNEGFQWNPRATDTPIFEIVFTQLFGVYSLQHMTYSHPQPGRNSPKLVKMQSYSSFDSIRTAKTINNPVVLTGYFERCSAAEHGNNGE